MSVTVTSSDGQHSVFFVSTGKGEEETKKQKDQTWDSSQHKVTTAFVKPLLNMDLDDTFGKESASWIHLSSPPQENWKQFSILSSAVHLNSVLAGLGQYRHAHMHGFIVELTDLLGSSIGHTD